MTSVSVTGDGAISCSGTFGTIVGYDNQGAELGRQAMQLIDPADCSPDENPDGVTFGAQGTLQISNGIIARFEILPMSPLEFPVFDLVGHASAVREPATQHIRLAFGAAAIALAAVSPLHAQRAETVKQHEKDCEQAARRIEKGHPEKKLGDAMATLFSCGASTGAALAGAAATYSSETDTAALDQFWQYADAWRDSAVFEAAVSLATSSSATAEARVFAVRHLLILASPFERFAYAGLTAGQSTTTDSDGNQITTFGCGAMLTSAAPDLVGTPLPANFASRIQSTLAALAEDPSAPQSVRNAARCANS